MNKILIFATLCLVIPNTYAQEITANGHLQSEASWSALTSLVENAKKSASIAQITADKALDKATKIEACGNLNQIYAPNAKDADPATGCKSITAQPTIKMFGGYGGWPKDGRGPILERNIGKWDACFMSRHGTDREDNICEVRQGGSPINYSARLSQNYMDGTPSSSQDWIMHAEDAHCAVICIRY